MFKETMKGTLFGLSVLASSMVHAYLNPLIVELHKDMYADLKSPDPLNLQVGAYHGTNDCGYSDEQLRSAITAEAARHKIQPNFVSSGDPNNGKLALFVSTSCLDFYGEKQMTISVRFGDPRTKPAKMWATEFGVLRSKGDWDSLDSGVRQYVRGALHHYGHPNDLPRL